MSRRILDETTKSTFASDDYLYMDGETDGSSKITPNNLVSSTTPFRNLSNYVNQDLYNAIGQNTTDIEGIQTDITDLKADIGDLDELETTDKSSLVGAINEARGSGGSGLTEDVKQALLDCFENVTWKDDVPSGRTYIDALEDALYPPADLVSISAVYTQSGTVYDTDTLDSLKTDLVVTALYDDSTTETVTTYTLSGTLATGTSTITVTYGGKTATFNVTVVTHDLSYVTDGLIAYWDGIDNTGSGHNSSALTWVDLVNGYELPLRETTHTTWGNDCIQLDGTSEQGLMTSTQLWTRPTNATIEFVFKTNVDATSQVLGNFDVSDDYITGTKYDVRRHMLFSDGTLNFVGRSGYSYTNPEESFLDIHKTVATYNEFTVVHAYVNNTEVSLSSATHSWTLTGTKQYRIGFEASGNTTGKVNGKLYAIRVYNRQLTESELTQNYNYDVDRFGLAVD